MVGCARPEQVGAFQRGSDHGLKLLGWRVARAVYLVAALLVVTAPFIRAEDDGIATLRKEVGALKRTVERLDKRVESLEQQLVAEPTPGPERAEASQMRSLPAAPPAPMPETSIRDSWRRIERGISAKEVEALLGPAQRTMELAAKTVWYYSYPGIGSGSIVFARDGHVVDWQRPPLSAWRW